MASPTTHPIAPKASMVQAGSRNSALDFTKGFLVLLMVIYHWFNYFIGPDAPIYKYIRFLTPSFIFITGFIIANIYLAKYDVRDPRLPLRLATRGLKIIAVFSVLNVLIGIVLPSHNMSPISEMFLRRFFGIVTPGVKDAAFPVLVPIGQILLISAVLVFGVRFSRFVVHAVCGVAFVGVALLRVSGIENPNAELIAIGLLGIVLGMIPLRNLIQTVDRPALLAITCILFNLSVWRWGEPYILQVLGVCLNIAIIYLFGESRWAATWTGKVIVLLGKYSLFGYISQIAILQILRRTMSADAPGLFLSFVLAVIFTVCSVMILDAARKRSALIDRPYRLIFS